MTWKELLAQGRVERRPASKEELHELRSLVERSLADARLEGLSTDGKFGHAYEAARALSTMVVRASGYRVRAHGGGHYNAFLALEAADIRRFARHSVYFNTCREKRNELSYETAGVVTETEAPVPLASMSTRLEVKSKLTVSLFSVTLPVVLYWRIGNRLHIWLWRKKSWSSQD